jgi:uncharacterized protein YhfF
VTAKKPKAEPKPRGAPSKFKPEFTPHIEMLCRLGATDAEIAFACGVTRQTFHNWRTVHAEFFDTIMRAKAEADREVVASLFKRAKGYEFESLRMSKTGDPVVITDHYPPDPTSAIFWLKNRNTREWRDRQENVNLNADAADADELGELLDVLDGRARAAGSAKAEKPELGEAVGPPLEDAEPLSH